MEVSCDEAHIFRREPRSNGQLYLLETGGLHFLIDCGMEQGKNVYENQPLPVAPGEIDGVLLTHAHIDHSGHLPLLAKQGYRGKIYE